MFKYIYDIRTNQKLLTNSKQGKQLLKKYISNYQKIGSGDALYDSFKKIKNHFLQEERDTKNFIKFMDNEICDKIKKAKNLNRITKNYKIIIVKYGVERDVIAIKNFQDINKLDIKNNNNWVTLYTIRNNSLFPNVFTHFPSHRRGWILLSNEGIYEPTTRRRSRRRSRRGST